MPVYGFGPASQASAVGTGIAFSRYWRLLADELGLYDGDLSVSSLAATESGRRHLIIAAMQDDEGARDAWAGGYAYAHTSPVGTQLKLLGSGFHGQHGAFGLANPPSSAIPISTRVELSKPLPIKRHGALKGVADLVNDALRRVWVLARLQTTGAGSRSISLTSRPFIHSEDQIRALYDDHAYGPSEPLEMSRFDHRMVTDGATRTLVTDVPYATGDVFEIEVYVRGDRLIHDGSAWGYPTVPGLVNDTDRAAVPEHQVVTLGMVKGLQQLRKLVKEDRELDRAARRERLAEIDRDMVPWRAAAFKILRDELPTPVTKPTPSFFEVSEDTADAGDWA